ncbi:dihydropteroate synthase [Bacillaceae bacterium]
MPFSIECRNKCLVIGERTLIMGILNVTPDSFSDGGKYNDVERAVAHAQKMVAEGADIIDIGGESTRPGARLVPASEELARVLPVIEAVKEAVDVPLSIDTYKADVAERALEAGVHIINDVWGGKADPRMVEVAAKWNVPIILMHNREEANYGGDLLEEMIRDLQESVDLAVNAGVRREMIILDPGIGFGKTYEHNLEVMRRLGEIVALGYPVLLGTSRKSLIGKTLGLPVEERVEGTAATVALGIAQGCEIVRVHDVKEMARVARMTDAIVRPARREKGESDG